MAASSPALKGLIPVLVTPFFENYDIDYQGLQREVEYLLSSGVKWMSIGYGSEVESLNDEELRNVTAVVKSALGTNGYLVGNVEMSEDCRATKHRIEHASALGADAVMLRPALFQEHTTEDIFNKIVRVANLVSVPLIFQDAPQHTSVYLSAPMIARLVQEAKTILAVKIEPPNAAVKIGEVRDALADEELIILGGRGGGDIVHEFLRGASGTMPGPAFPNLFQSIIKHINDGDIDRALETWGKVLPFNMISDRSFESLLWVNKYVLSSIGVIKSPRLRKHGDIDERLREETDRLLEIFIRSDES